jgi:hypothetical protein
MKEECGWLRIILYNQDNPDFFGVQIFELYICAGEMAERSNAAVLKTVDCNRSGGSNPSLSALLRKWSEFVGNDFCETLIIKLNSQKVT